MVMVAEEQPQINQGQGEIEVQVAENYCCEFGFDPDADADASDESDAAAGPANRSFMCGGRGRWVLAAATLLFAAFAMFLGSASVMGIISHRNQAQALNVNDISGSNSISKSGKSKCGKSSSSSYVGVRRLKDLDEDEVVSNTDIVDDRGLDVDNNAVNDDDCEEEEEEEGEEEDSSFPSGRPSLSLMPSDFPSLSPSLSTNPTTSLSSSPSASASPSEIPSEASSKSPSSIPSSVPSIALSLEPSLSAIPTSQPSLSPSISAAPSNTPSSSPSEDSNTDNTNAEEPDGDAVRAKYEGSVTLANLDCDNDLFCVQNAQNALKATLEEIICSDLTPPLVPPCWVAVKPNPQIESLGTDETGRRRLDLTSLWEFIASVTIAGEPDQATIDSASAAISDVVASVAAAVGGYIPIEEILGGVVAAFEVLVAELSPDPYEWTAVIPNVTGYQLVGEGYCTSSLREYYGVITYDASSVQECVAKCKDSVCFPENGWTLTGVDMELRLSNCYCNVDMEDVVEGSCSCSDSAADLGDMDYGPGTGRTWFSGPEGQSDGALCFRFI